MHRRGWLALMPIVLCLFGCLGPEQTERASFLNRFHQAPISPDHALIEIALIERPLGDEYINEQIWKQADELIGDSERRAALDENGLRIGQLVGSLPGGFQQLLLSKRSCSNPQGMIFPAGQPRSIFLSPLPLPQTGFDLVQGKTRTYVALDQARYLLSVTTKFATHGRTVLTLTPKVEHGEPIFPFQPVPERSTWEVRVDKASKQYPELSWEVSLGPNQYFIVGARLERERTIGQIAFTEPIGEETVQRLLVIRNCRSVTAHEAQQSTVEELVRLDKSPPLALQATLPVSRAKPH